MQKSALNKQGKFGVKILWRYTDMAIFVLRCFILTHPVHQINKTRNEVYMLSKSTNTDCIVLNSPKNTLSVALYCTSSEMRNACACNTCEATNIYSR